MLSDTVGFISDLPTMLVAAFRATLEEVIEADVILHVRDISHEDAEAQQHDVEEVLRQIGVDPEASDHVVEVWNKIDKFDAEGRDRIANIAARSDGALRPLLVSAQTGEGVDALLDAIEQKLAATRVTLDLTLDAGDGAGISWLHRNTEVLDKTLRDDGQVDMTVRVDESRRDATLRRFTKGDA
jgi:GTP-binding protein HflX